MKEGTDNEKLQENAIKQPGITERRPDQHFSMKF